MAVAAHWHMDGLFWKQFPICHSSTEASEDVQKQLRKETDELRNNVKTRKAENHFLYIICLLFSCIWLLPLKQMMYSMYCKTKWKGPPWWATWLFEGQFVWPHKSGGHGASSSWLHVLVFNRHWLAAHNQSYRSYSTIGPRDCDMEKAQLMTSCTPLSRIACTVGWHVGDVCQARRASKTKGGRRGHLLRLMKPHVKRSSGSSGIFGLESSCAKHPVVLWCRKATWMAPN